MGRLAYATLALLALVACTAAPAACTSGPAVSPSATGCAAACDKVRVCNLGLFETAKGGPCAEVCENAQANGVDFGTACLSSATDCASARRCN